MKVIDIYDIAGTDREIRCPNGGFVSYRFLLGKDKMGFGMHKTFVPQGIAQHWRYRNHLEACYCVSGRGILTNVRTGQSFEIRPDMVYALDQHDDHTFKALVDTVLISVFNPPLVGPEVHKFDGSYATASEVVNV